MRTFARFGIALVGSVVLSSEVAAQSDESGDYLQGPTRPMDGSPRRGVYSAQPAPRYEHTPERLGYDALPPDRPPIWGGLYVGATGGYGWQSTKMDAFGLPGVTQGGSRFGGHAGYNWQLSKFVVGVEGDISRGHTSSSTTLGGASAMMETSWQTTFRARAGVSIGQALVYVTAGAALNNQKLTVTTAAPSLSSSNQRFGTVFGGGIEMMLTSRLSTRLEALHFDMRDGDRMLGGSAKQSDNVVRAGLTFHFN